MKKYARDDSVQQLQQYYLLIQIFRNFISKYSIMWGAFFY